MREITTLKPADRWKQVSADDTYVYLLWNAPIEALSQTFKFRQPESREEAIVPRDIEGERAGDGDGDQDGDGDLDGTTSGGDTNLI